MSITTGEEDGFVVVFVGGTTNVLVMGRETPKKVARSDRNSSRRVVLESNG